MSQGPGGFTISDDAHGPLSRERLAAYLDGQLSAEEQTAIETRLAADPQVRRELQLLERAWDALDELPEVPHSTDFTRSTIEMVALAATSERRATSAGRRWLAGGLLLAALGIGFATALWWPSPTDALVRDLPLLEHLDAYRQVDSLEFLRALEKAGLFADQEPKGDPN